jgi:predicted HTH transcriptional regulator
MLQTDLETAIDHQSESNAVDYKAFFDVASSSDWIEIIKDVVAFANSGGGVMIFGISDDGSMSAFDCLTLNSLDPANLTDKLYKYTGQQFSGFSFLKAMRNEKPLFAIAVDGVDSPLVFSKPGTYDVGGGKQKTAFSAGTVYFRHGAKSEPANADDLRVLLRIALKRCEGNGLQEL